MALKTWHRIGLLALAMALVAIVMLPSRPLPEPGTLAGALFRTDFGSWGYFRPYEYMLSQTLSDLKDRRRATVMADSLIALTRGPRAVRSADGAITVLYERPLTADSARVWLGMLERELALAPRGSGSGIPIVVALRSAPEASRRADASDQEALAHDGAARLIPWVAMRFLSPRGEHPTCFAALRLTSRTGENFNPSELIERDHRTGVARTAALDWCLVYARFGAPGALVDQWAGHRIEIRRWWAPGDNLSWALESGRRGRTRDDMTPTLSPRELAAYWADPLNSACVRGARVPCLKSVGLIPDPTLRQETSWISRVRRSLLAALMLKDPVKFERFWRSNEHADLALEHAYGRPASDLIAEFKQTYFSLPPIGPRASAGALLSSLGWAVGVMAIGLVLAMRRQVSS